MEPGPPPREPRRLAPATTTLVALNVLVYAVMLAVDGFGRVMGFRGETLIGFGADVPRAVLGHHELWRLVTSTLVHVNVLHIGFNMTALWQVGRLLEARWGMARIFVAYLVTGVIASLVSALWLAHQGGPGISAGASGAIMGLIGCAAAVGQVIGGERGAVVRNAMLRWALTVLVLGVVAGRAGMGIDNAAHIGGLVSGGLLGFAVEKLGTAGPRRRSRELLGAALFLVVAGGCFGLAWRGARAEDSIFGGADETVAHAEARLRRVIARSPDDAAAHYDLAITLLRQDRLDDARAELERARQLAPTDVMPRIALIVLAAEAGDRGRAEADAKALLAEHPGDAALAERVERALGPRLTPALPQKILQPTPSPPPSSDGK